MSVNQDYNALIKKQTNFRNTYSEKVRTLKGSKSSYIGKITHFLKV